MIRLGIDKCAHCMTQIGEGLNCLEVQIKAPRDGKYRDVIFCSVACFKSWVQSMPWQL